MASTHSDASWLWCLQTSSSTSGQLAVLTTLLHVAAAVSVVGGRFHIPANWLSNDEVVYYFIYQLFVSNLRRCVARCSISQIIRSVNRSQRFN